MSKRLVLESFLIATLLLPVVAFADDTELPLANPNSDYIGEGALCDIDTLKVSKGDKTLYALWEPLYYDCKAGEEYLKATKEEVGCKPCPSNAYCEGFQGRFDGVRADHGLEVCPQGYVGNSVFAREVKKCTQEFNCSVLNPVVGKIEHATTETVYLNDVSVCTADFDFTSPYVFDSSICSLSCVVKELKCESGYKANEDNTVCEEDNVICEAGTYLPENKKECVECPGDAFCAGGRAYFDDRNAADQGISECPEGLKAPKGAKSVADCGKLLRVDGDALYLYADEDGSRKKEGKPRFVVTEGDKNWYADMTPVSEGGPRKVSQDEGVEKELHVMVGDVEYTVHTTILEPEESTGQD